MDAADISQTKPSSKPLNPDDLDETVVRAVYKFLKYEDESDSLEFGRSFARRSVVDTTKFEKEEAENEKAALEAERQRRLNHLLRKVLKLSPALHFLGQLSGWVFGLSLVLMVAGIGYDMNFTGGYHVWLAAFPLGGLGWYGRRAIEKKEKQLKKDKALLPEVLVLVLPQLSRKNRMRAAYCDAAAALLEQQAAWDDETTRTFLRLFKTLLQTGRQTAVRRAGLEQAMSRHTVKSILEEADLLDARTNKASDPEARETFQESRELLQLRLTRAQSLEPLRQQMEAQEEVVTQSLAEAQSALSGAGLAQWAFASSQNEAQAPPALRAATAVPLARLERTLLRLGRQAESVEQAVRGVIVGWVDAEKGADAVAAAPDV